MRTMIPVQARKAIIQGVYAGHPLSNLEQLGLPIRVIELLENSRFQIVTLEDLVSLSRDDLLSIRSLGKKSLECILNCLACYDELLEAPNIYSSPEEFAGMSSEHMASY